MTADQPDTAGVRKARGAFFTPPDVAAYVAAWAVRAADDSVLEPSCGEAAFLLPAVQRLRAMGAQEDLRRQVHGAELHAASAAEARSMLRAAGVDVTIHTADFLRRDTEVKFTAVIGNPPYVRYQAFSGESRASAKRAALRAGVTLTNLASSWAAFTVHSALHVEQGGRLGLVLPAEILSVNYAAPVRDFLMQAFRRVRLVFFAERVFPGVMEDVVLLLAEGRGEGPTDHCELLHARNGAALVDLADADVRRWSPRPGSRWSLALVDAGAGQAYADVTATPRFNDLESWGSTTLGMVTGNNGFFALSGAEVSARGLTRQDVVRISPPGSGHLRAMSLTMAQLDRLDDNGKSTWMFRPSGEPSRAGKAYIVEGEKRGVDQAYKCQVRTPWWRVPYLATADLLLTYMNADTARLCVNGAKVHHLNSVHGVYLNDDVRALGRDLLPLAALNSVTMLGAELVGRSYGGGVLKLEPREADVWPMPSPALVRDHADALRGVRRRVRDLLKAGRLGDASHLVDAVLFDGVVTNDDLESLRAGRAALHGRRVARSRTTLDSGARPTGAIEALSACHELPDGS